MKPDDVLLLAAHLKMDCSQRHFEQGQLEQMQALMKSINEDAGLGSIDTFAGILEAVEGRSKSAREPQFANSEEPPDEAPDFVANISGAEESPLASLVLQAQSQVQPSVRSGFMEGVMEAMQHENDKLEGKYFAQLTESLVRSGQLTADLVHQISSSSGDVAQASISAGSFTGDGGVKFPISDHLASYLQMVLSTPGLVELSMAVISHSARSLPSYRVGQSGSYRVKSLFSPKFRQIAGG